VGPWLVPTEETLLPVGATTVAVNEVATCALLSGQATCMLSNTTATPTITGPGPAVTNFLSLAAGERFFCGLRSSGTVYCFGRNDTSQLGDPLVTAFEDWVGTDAAGAPVPLSAELALGGAHACYMHVDGSGSHLVCWGDGSQRQLAIDPMMMPLVYMSPREVLTDVGASHTFVMSSASAMCWGSGVTTTCWGTMFLGDPGGFGMEWPPTTAHTCP
jgi:alpha-tubulin suppressor-like RCC1 family protein